MDTNSNILAEKKVVSVEILHLDELGYGPQGKHTRREWRQECLENLLAGKVEFESWQEKIKSQIIETMPDVKFGCEFPDNTYFDNYYYLSDESKPYTLDFVGNVFEDDFDVATFAFQFPINFNGSSFYKSARFSAASFGLFVDLGRCTFIGTAYFYGTTFSMLAGFFNSVFHDLGVFTNALFLNHAYLDRVKFSYGATFHNANFAARSSFMHLEASGSINFSSAKFKEASFHFAQFKLCSFDDATFENDANFTSAKFVDHASFVKTIFNSRCIFNNFLDDETKIWNDETTFGNGVDFENAIFKNVGHFERVRFLKYVPSFLGVDNASTRLEFSGDKYFFITDNSEQAVKQLGQLKRLSEEHGQTDQALNFNAMELRAKRLQTEPQPATFSFKVVTWLYEKLSDYGRSFTQPLIAYLALLLITLWLAIVNTIIFSAKNCESEKWYLFTNLWREQIECVDKTKIGETKVPLSGWRAAFEYTSYRASGILDFADADKQTIAVANRLFDQPIEPWWMRIWGVFKAIASTALLFLAALGLRNKYRIK